MKNINLYEFTNTNLDEFTQVQRKENGVISFDKIFNFTILLLMSRL